MKENQTKWPPGFLEDLERKVNPLVNEANESVKIAVSYAQIGLKWGFLLNGGALVALPAIVGTIPDISSCSIKAAAILYIIGLALCAICSLAAYKNFMTVGTQRRWSANRVEWQLSENYLATPETRGAYQDAIKRATAGYESCAKWLRLTYYISISAACLGFGSFVVASIILVW